ncbi:MAG: substrate-binding domain-containing protein [Gammaproteobacteria bacterium]|nr:substrate-binding domain-containing protein [Gammaproteobacteria bacterium]
MRHRSSSALLALLLLTGIAAWAQPAPYIVLQSTTSTQDSGLFDDLLPRFKKETGIEVRVVAVGTGQALKNAANGDGDVLLVHERAEEEKFIADGFGVARFDLMYNDFVLVGPESDPAGVRGMADVVAAMRRIAAGKHPFASRADDSGTHSRELQLWQEAGIDVVAASGTWYRETGSGMGATLNTSIGIGAYTLCDRATWVSFRNKAKHVIAVEGDARLHNQYGLILVNPKRHPRVHAAAGQRFIDWLLGPTGQAAIGAFRVDGQQIYIPNAR